MTALVYREILKRAILNSTEKRPREEGIIEVTQLTNCSNKIRLAQQYGYSDNTLFLFARGHVLHDLIEELLLNEDQGLTAEVKMIVNLNGNTIMGIADLIDETRDTIIEIKTTSITPKEPYAEHILQLRIYLNLYEKITGKSMKGILLYFSMKDVVEFEINEKISDNELLDLIEKYKENKNIKKEQCKYCDFFDLCKLHD